MTGCSETGAIGAARHRIDRWWPIKFSWSIRAKSRMPNANVALALQAILKSEVLWTISEPTCTTVSHRWTLSRRLGRFSRVLVVLFELGCSSMRITADKSVAFTMPRRPSLCRRAKGKFGASGLF